MRIGRTIPPAASPITFGNILNAVKGLFREQRVLEEFAGNIRSYFDVEHVFLLSSGKSALKVILTALHRIRPDRDEVIVPAYTCYSVPSAVVAAGLKVVPCDVDEFSLDMNAEVLSTLICRHTLAVVPCHLFGIPAQVEGLRSVTDHNQVFIVEDAAQAMGAQSGGKYLGTIGDAGFFSLGRGKPMNTVEGGVIITSRRDIGSHIENIVGAIKDYTGFQKVLFVFKALMLWLFTRPELFWFPRLIPYLRLGETIYDPDFETEKMCGAQAGLARGWEARLRKFSRIRSDHAKAFKGLTNETGFTFLPGGNDKDCAYIRLPFLMQDEHTRNDVLALSEGHGLGIMPSYPDEISSIPGTKQFFKPVPFPATAHGVARRLLTLPVHPFVRVSDRTRIVDVFKRIEHSATGAG